MTTAQKTTPAANQEVINFGLPVITTKNVSAIATAIFAQMQGEKFEARSDLVQSFMSALRTIRDQEKEKTTTKRPRKSVAEVIAESLGKPLGDLQAATVVIAEVVPMNFSKLFEISSRVGDDEVPQHPLNKAALEFIAEHRLSLVPEKTGSRGKGKLVLRQAPAETAKAA